MTQVAGYPVHAVRTYTRRVNEHGVVITSWTGACEKAGTQVGSQARFGDSLKARKAELCKDCFPAGHRTYHPEAKEI